MYSIMPPAVHSRFAHVGLSGGPLPPIITEAHGLSSSLLDQLLNMPAKYGTEL